MSFDNTKDGKLRKSRYDIVLYEYKLFFGKIVKLIFGKAANTPYGIISDAQKIKIGQALC